MSAYGYRISDWMSDVGASDRRPGEDRLRHHGEGDDADELQADDGDDRDQDHLQHVHEDDAAFGQPLGPRELHELERHRLTHAGARQADDQRYLEEREIGRRQDEMRESVQRRERSEEHTSELQSLMRIS